MCTIWRTTFIGGALDVVLDGVLEDALDGVLDGVPHDYPNLINIRSGFDTIIS